MRSGPSWKKKQKNCDPENPEDEIEGDQWDLTGIDVESRLLVSVFIGKRSKENVKRVVADFADRTNNVPPALITTDDCSTYAEALLEQYGETVVPEKTGAPGRPRDPFKQWPEKAVYATVNKTYSKVAVKAVSRKLVHGTEEDLVRALESSSCSTTRSTPPSWNDRTLQTDPTMHAKRARLMNTQRTCLFTWP